MKKLFFCLAVASIMMSCSQNKKTNAAGGALNAGNAPVIKFDNESYDFGKIKQGDKVSYDFMFTNTGKSPLIITNATASCGCTTPEWHPTTPVMPGNKGRISVVFNSAGRSGLQDKQITITANTNPAQTMVHLVGEVLTKK